MNMANKTSMPADWEDLGATKAESTFVGTTTVGDVTYVFRTNSTPGSLLAEMVYSDGQRVQCWASKREASVKRSWWCRLFGG